MTFHSKIIPGIVFPLLYTFLCNSSKELRINPLVMTGNSSGMRTHFRGAKASLFFKNLCFGGGIKSNQGEDHVTEAVDLPSEAEKWVA